VLLRPRARAPTCSPHLPCYATDLQPPLKLEFSIIEALGFVKVLTAVARQIEKSSHKYYIFLTALLQ